MRFATRPNINGLMFTIYSALNASFIKKKAGTILNITSVTGLEVPPFPGESVYHTNKAAQEAFSNALRNELCGTNIRVLVLRPGCVATNFHSLRVDHDKEKYNKFFEGFTPLDPTDIAGGAVYMLEQPLNVSIEALDVVPSGELNASLKTISHQLTRTTRSPQRSLTVFDRDWNERQGIAKE
ncbi:Short-chain dehydrogenase reductase SDR protein [Rutstroemia sp. NJR-2017a BVV2]|nr:Short-chain dehydrogenase reductase SDR protein [Rutstroemia sp. NJR-2017a BVV2]